MTPEFVSLRPGDTVRQALDTIRRTGIHKETVYTCYVLEHRQLLGVVSAKDLLTAAEDAAVADPDGHGCGICGYAHRPGRGRPAPGEI